MFLSNRSNRFKLAMLAGVLATSAGIAFAHGDVVPQAVDTHTLPQLGPKWLDSNPYSKGKSDAHGEALRIGTSAYNQNCARCHGLEAISGGIAPDLRHLDDDCAGLRDAKKQAACVRDVNDWFVGHFRHGVTRNGAVYMPGFEGILSQEAAWAIKTYLESLRVKPLAEAK